MGLVRRAARRILRRVRSTTEAEARPSSSQASVPRPRAPVASQAETDLSRIECGAQELKERLDAGEAVVVVDVREPHETASGIIAGARVIPLGQLEDRWEALKDCNEIVCYCALGGRSLQAAGLLRSKGLFNATSMEGGVVAWQGIGGELIPPTSR